jgi:hypothetical protein
MKKQRRKLKSNELRVGNLVCYECTTHIVVGLSDDGVVLTNWHKALEEHPYTDYDRNHEGIFLDEQLLRFFGFSDEKVRAVFVNGKVDLERVFSDSTEWSVHVFENELDIVVEYVHELQNIMFTLTGEELKFDINNIPL